MGITIAGRKHLEEALNSGRFTVGELLRTRTTGRTVLPFALAFQDPDGTPAGLASILLDVGWLDQYVARKALPETAAVLIADHSGSILARVPDSRLVGQRIPERYASLLHGVQKDIVEVPGLDGTLRIIAYSPLESGAQGLFIAVGIDRKAAMAPVDTAIVHSLVSFLGLLLLTGAAASWLLKEYMRTRTQSEEAVRAAEARLRLALRSANAGVFELDPNTEQGFWSEESHNIFGLPAGGGAPTWETFRSLVHPDDLGPLSTILGDIKARLRQEFELEYRVIRPDGSVRWVISPGHVHGGVQGKPLRIVGLNIDITERKRLREALSRSEERLSMVLSSVEAGVWSWDVRQGLLNWSEGVYRLFGQDSGTFIPSLDAWLAAVHPEDRDRVQRLIDDTLASGGHEYRVEHRILHPSRGVRWLMGLGRVLYDPKGRPLSMSGLVLDITQSKAMEQALRESERRYRGLVQSQTDMVVRFDTEGRYTFVNETACRELGATRAALLSRCWSDYVHPEDIEQVRRTVASIASDAEHRAAVDCRVLTVSGPRWYTWEGAAVSDRGGFTEIQAVGRDVTERRAVEEQLLRAKAEAEQANASKSKFLAAASHDLRQPMQSLFLFAGALKGHLHEEKGHSILAMLERGLDTLKGLLDSLLDVSRLDAGIIQPHIDDFSLGPLLDEVEAAYAPIALSKGLEFRVDQACAGMSVHSDRLLLGRMLRNLVENAVRYTERGEVHVTCQQTPSGVALEVHDSGIGISADQLERIFEEFHQIGNTERDRSQGLGLGLAIVKRLSALLDHPVQVQSEPGKGSVFAVEVPRGQDAVTESSVPEMTTERQTTRRFAVLVDDDVIVLTGLQTLLREWGYDVLIAGAIGQALERLKATGRVPDVVVADYRLRDHEVGTEAITKIREAAGRHVPGIILTGELNGDWQGDAEARGLHVVYKPVTPRQLRSVIDRCMEGAS